MATSATNMDVEVCDVDSRGRFTLPKRFRDALGLDDSQKVVVFRNKETGSVTLETLDRDPAEILAEHALKEEKDGDTRTIYNPDDDV